MGCGSSSLKGDDAPGVNDPAPQPVKKAATNFSTVDYDTTGTNRPQAEFAPDESEAQRAASAAAASKKSTDVAPGSSAPGAAGVAADETLDPAAKGIDQTYPHEKVGAAVADPSAAAGGVGNFVNGEGGATHQAVTTAVSDSVDPAAHPNPVQHAQ